MSVEAVLAEARAAKAAGAGRFCMGAAWRSPKDRDLDQVCEMVEGVRALGLETCVTLGMLEARQARRLKAAGLDYYNHNLDTAPEDYGRIISTRTYQDRLDTLEHVRDAGIAVCCGGIVGMGETREDRVGLIAALANLPVHPESVPINMLMQVEGTLAFSLTGILAAIAGPLAEAQVSIFAVSTYDTDYLLVSEGELEKAVSALEAAGHAVRRENFD